ncbi:MAG TPA: AAC(3) family N-acetyltransferase [Usitatibacter sp.]|nr:AAC(3) family N-acetyltransferase [Usitatibacter sp.]
MSNPIGPAALRAALDRAIGAAPGTLLVHASFSACGRFTGGSDDVLAALGERCSTLAFPTHTYSYPENGAPAPLFDPRATPSRTGLLTEIFRISPGVTRSIQSTHSIAARGAEAAALCAGHYLNDTPCGRGTPYERMVRSQAAVLLFGATFHSYTLYHTAEDASGSQFAYEPATVDLLEVIDESGNRRHCRSRRQSRAPRRFREAGGLLESAGIARRVPLGAGILLYVPDCARAHDFLVERLRRVPDFLYATCTEPLR